MNDTKALEDAVMFLKNYGYFDKAVAELDELRTENADLRESEPKKIKRLRALVDNLKLCNDRLQASLLEWGK